MVTQFTHPSLHALGAAFVEGKLELEGSISDVIRVCDEWSQALINEDEDAQPERSVHDKETDAQAISYHYDLSNAFLSTVARQRHGVFLRLFRNRQ